MEHSFIAYRTIVLVLLNCLFSIVTVEAQDYIANVQHFGIEEGLSQRSVYCLFQDSRGFIWVGTQHGLNRFDGYDFRVLTREKDGLFSNEIRRIEEDEDGWLWVFSSAEGSEGNWTNIDFVHTETMEVNSWKEHFGGQQPFGQNELTTCLEGKGQSLFLRRKDGELWKYDKKKKFHQIGLNELKNFFPSYSSPQGTIWGSEQLPDKSLWVEMDANGVLLNRYEFPARTKFFVSGQDSKGNLVFQTTREGINRKWFLVNPDNKLIADNLSKFSHETLVGEFSYPRHQVVINPLDHSYWWMGEKMAISFPDKEYSILLSEKYPGTAFVNTILFSKNGETWLGSVDGLYEVKLEQVLFQNLLAQKFEDTKLTNRIECRGIMEDAQGNIFINSYAGTFHVSQYGKVLNNNVLKADESILPAMGIFKDRSGHIWFGGHKLARMDEAKGDLTYYFFPERVTNTAIWAFYEDLTGGMWFAGLEGCFYFLEPGRDTLQIVTFDKTNPKLKRASILHFCEDSRSEGKRVWLASNTGLYLLDVQQKKILQRYWTGGKGKFYIPHNNIHHICERDNGDLWLATGGGGLILIPNAQDSKSPAEKGAAWHQFTELDGLPSNILYAVYEDDFGFLWISSANGIIRFNLESYQSLIYLPKNGLPHYEFNRISHYQAEDGRLYFGSLNGVTSFYPKNFQNALQKEDAPMAITNFRQFDHRKDKVVDKMAEWVKDKRIVLHPGDLFFSLDFALLSYHLPDRIRYAYKMESTMKDWLHLNDRTLQVSGLPYGKHLLRIRGQAAGGQYSTQELKIPIQVLKPFYLQTWFLLIAGIIFFASGPLFFRWRTRQMKKRQRMLEKEVAERTSQINQDKQIIEKQAGELRQLDKVKSRFFANISHELRTPLTLLLGPIGSVLKTNQLEQHNRTLLKKAQKSGKDLLHLISEILDLSKMEAGRMEIQEKAVLLYPMLRRYFAHFEAHAKLQGVQFLFEYEATESLQILLDSHKFEKVVNNFLSNAFKFTPKGGTITLRLQEFDSNLLLSVADTGQGIHPDDVPNIFDRFYQTNRPDAQAEGGTGIGLALVEEYALLFGGKTWVESTFGGGSVFYFEFPKREVVVSLSQNSEDDMAGNKGLPSDLEDEPEWQEDSDPERTVLAPSEKFSTSELSSQEVGQLSATLLIVEDNPSLRDYLETILSPYYHILTAENGQAALEALNSPPPPAPLKGEPLPSETNAGGSSPFRGAGGGGNADLIISDLMMPVMDGYQLLEKLKSDELYRQIPVIILTARAAIQDKLKALRIGVDDYILKPFEEEELLVRIANLLNNYRQRREFAAAEMTLPPEISEEAISLTKSQTEWLEQLEALILREVQNDQLSVDWIADQLQLSRRQLLRRLKTLTGIVPKQYIQEVRLQEARRLLEAHLVKRVKAAAWAVSFRDERYFSKLFRERFGKSPSEFL